MYKSIKIRLYPDADQTIELNKMLGSFRFVYNKCLDRKITSYKESNISETEKTLYHYINDLKKTEEYAWLVEINTLIQHKAIQQMLGAFDNFYKHHKGFPNFKSKHENKITCKIEAGVISKRNDYSTRKLTLTKKIKDVKFRCSDKYIKILCENKIKSATLIKTCSGNYFLSLVVDFGDIDLKLPTVKNKIGIDLGVKDFIVTSDNKIFENQHFNKSKTKRIKRLQRQLSKKQKGSNNRNKIRIKLARIYEHITNRKTNFLHNITTQLANENQVICIEDLNVKGMLRNHKLAESIQEMNFGEFRNMLEYKCKWYGRELVIVDRFYPSSKTCNHCGHINKNLKLTDRKWICPQCREIIYRDYNAAKNILDEGIKILVGRCPAEFKPLENPTVDDRLETNLKSNGSVKKET